MIFLKEEEQKKESIQEDLGSVLEPAEKNVSGYDNEFIQAALLVDLLLEN